MTNKYYNAFERDLTVLFQKGIHTLDKLQTRENEVLYEKLWLSSAAFITNVAFRSSTNRYRIPRLITLGVDNEDLQMDTLLHFFNKIDLVLAKPLQAQLPYVFTLVTNFLIDRFHKRLKEVGRTVSIDDNLTGDADDNAFEIQIADPVANTESNYLAKEKVVSIISLLTSKPSELLAYISCNLLRHKPSYVASKLFAYGISKVLENTLWDISAEYDLDTYDLKQILANDYSNAFNVQGLCEKEISAQVSRYLYLSNQKVRKTLSARADNHTDIDRKL